MRYMIAALLLTACQPAAQTPIKPGADYSNAPEWVKRNPLDPQKPFVDAKQPTAMAASIPPPPVIIARAEDLPVAADGLVSVDGLKQIRIGMTLNQVNAALGTNVLLVDPDDAESDCTYLDLHDAAWPSIMYVDGKVARVSVYDASIATYGGIRVGDNAAKVRALFGASLNEQIHFYLGPPAKYLTLWTRGGPAPADGQLSREQYAAQRDARGIRFETDDAGTITAFYAGDGSIEYVEGCS